MRSRSITGGELLCTRYIYFDSGKSSVSLRGTACADPWSARTMAPRARNAPPPWRRKPLREHVPSPGTEAEEWKFHGCVFFRSYIYTM